MNVLMTKMPPKVTASMARRNDQLPVSPPMVPESRVRISAIQAMATKPGRSPASPSGAIPVTHTSEARTTIRARESRASQAMSTTGPRASELSNA